MEKRMDRSLKQFVVQRESSADVTEVHLISVNEPETALEKSRNRKATGRYEINMRS
jgi:hypothetical protein